MPQRGRVLLGGGPRSSVAIIVHTLLTQTGLTLGREVKLVKRLIVSREKLGEVRDEPHRGRIGPAQNCHPLSRFENLVLTQSGRSGNISVRFSEIR